MNTINIQSSHLLRDFQIEQTILQEKTHKRKFEEIINTQNAEKDVKKSKSYFLSLDLSHPTIAKTVQTTADLWKKFTNFMQMEDFLGINLIDQDHISQLSKEEIAIIIQNKLAIPAIDLFSCQAQIIKFSEGETIISLVEKHLLMKHSLYFAKLWSSGLLESQLHAISSLEDIPQDHFEFLLNFLKNPNDEECFKDLDKEALFALIKTAHYLSLESIVKILEQKLIVEVDKINQSYQEGFIKDYGSLLDFANTYQLDLLMKNLENFFITKINIDNWSYQEKYLKTSCPLLDFAKTYHLNLMRKKLEKYLNEYLRKDLKEDKQQFKLHMDNFYKYLTEINLNLCEELTDEDLMEFKKCICLKNLDLSGTNITTNGLQVLPYLESLQSLDLLVNGQLDFKDNTSFDVFKNLKNLETFSLFGVTITSKGSQIFENLENLKSLALYECSLKEFQVPSKLQKLLISSCGELSNQFYTCLRDSRNLQALALLISTLGGQGGEDCSLDHLRQLKNCSNLKTLIISPFHETTKDPFEIIKEFNYLETLCIKDIETEKNELNQILAQIKEIKNLKILNINEIDLDHPVIVELRNKGVKITCDNNLFSNASMCLK